MDKNVNPIAAALFLVVAAVGAGAWFWASGEAGRYGGPAGMAVNPDGHLFIQIDNRLVEHDARGSYVRTHDLGDVGVELVLGGFDFFSNGDILLRRGPDTRSLWDNLRAFQRMTNESSLNPDVPGAGLYRCDLEFGSCDSFANPPIDFKTAFSVYIDRPTDTVYFADSSRHLVRKYSAYGEPLAIPAEGFRFPNQLLVSDRSLLIADTNHHRIQAIDTRDELFGEVLFSKSAVPPAAHNKGQKWPSNFAKIGDTWWINNRKTGMDYGGIYVFDKDWNYDRQIDIPALVDPISLVEFNETVVISDWYGDSVHQLSLDGDYLGTLPSEGLTSILDAFRLERDRYGTYQWTAAALALMLSLIILGMGTDWRGKIRKAVAANLPAVSDDPLWLQPLPENVKRMRSGLRSARYLMIMLALVTIGLTLFSGFSTSELQLILAGVAFFLVYLGMDWMMRISTNTAICLAGDRVRLTIHTGEEVDVPAASVFFSNTVVATNEVAIFLGQGQNPIYDRERVLEVLRARLPASQEVSGWQIQKMLLEMRHPFGLMLIAALFFMFLLMLAYYVEFVMPGGSP